MPSSEWREERRRARDEVRRLPDEIQRILAFVRRDDIRRRLADNILSIAKERADRRGLVRHDTSLLRLRGDRLLAVDERQMLREMNSPEFRQWVRAEVRRLLRTAHFERIDPRQDGLLIPDALPENVITPGTPWLPLADVGLDVASYHDGPPEGWWAMAAQVAAWISRRRDARGFDPDVRVLVFDPGAGGFARAVGAVTAPGRIVVQEYGDELSATKLPWVEHNRCTLGNGAFDLLVWSVPSPGVGGASHHGRIYRETHDANEQRSLGTVGPRRWRQIIRGLLKEMVPLLLNDNGIALLRLPLGYRVDERPRGHRPARRGYVDHRRLLDGVLEGLGGLRVASIIEEAAYGAVNQPFVGASRCAWRTGFLRKEEASR